MWILTVAVAFGVGTIPQTASAKGEVQANDETKPVQHQIVQIKDLIEDFDESEWTAITENGGKFGANIGGVERAKKGVINGYYDCNAQEFIKTKRPGKKVIVNENLPIVSDELKECHGLYTINLPRLKRIQLEMNYEILENDSSENVVEPCIKMYQQNRLEMDDFVLDESLMFHQSHKEKSIINYGEANYSTYSTTMDLSKWSGQSIKLELVTSFIKGESAQLRWTNLKLIGATFNYKFVPIKETDIGERNSNIQGINRLMTTPVVQSGTMPIMLDGLVYYPDTGPVPIYMNGRWVAYFNAVNYGYGDMYPYSSGTRAFDFINYSNNYHLGNPRRSTLQNSLLRGNPPVPSSDGSIVPYSVLEPYRPADPYTDFSWKYNWANWYTGIQSAFVATSGGNTRVHAFVHVEDEFKDVDNLELSLNSGRNIVTYGHRFVYARVGYARSVVNQPYDFQFTPAFGDSSRPEINNASPILECFQKESEIDTTKEGVVGINGPTAIVHESDGYVYLFYTRILQHDYWESLGATTQNYIGYDGSNICVARAPYSSVINENYSSSNNPWLKYYDGSFSEPGRGGYSTQIICDNGDETRIVTSIHKNSFLNEYVMVCWKLHHDLNQRETYIYITNNRDMTNWQSGIRVQDMYDEYDAPCRLIDATGSDTLCDDTMYFYCRNHKLLEKDENGVITYYPGMVIRSLILQ